MNSHKILSKKERMAIFTLFITQHKLKFNEIEKQLDMRSNRLSYHLDKMLAEEILERQGDYYLLTTHAESLIPTIKHITQKEQGPLSIVIAAIVNKNKICLLQRNKRPYQGYWGMIGGKIHLAESIKDCAVREAKEETNLNCSFDRVSAVLHERVKEKEIIKHGFVIFLCRLTTEQQDTKHTDEGKIQWFDFDALPENIIPSDGYMITQLLNKEFSCKDVLIEDKDGVLVNMEVTDGGRL